MKKILAVDDDATVLRHLCGVLTARGYSCSSTTDPHEALELIAREEPDLLVLDVNMPGLDGATVFGELKKSVRRLPVLFITAFQGTYSESSDAAHRLWSELAASGVVDMLYKPFREDTLFQKVESLIGSAR